jgi:putative ABC transport system substrate-binding protein
MKKAAVRSILVVATLLAVAVLVQAQQSAKVPRIGLLRVGSSPDPLVDAFRQGLLDLGYVEGKNIVVEYRWAEGRNERLPDLAGELVRLKVDAIVVGGNVAIRAAKKATNTIPIIMTSVGDPVGLQLVAASRGLAAILRGCPNWHRT